MHTEIYTHTHRKTCIDGLKSEISIWMCIYLYTHKKSVLFSDVTSVNTDHCGIK